MVTKEKVLRTISKYKSDPKAVDLLRLAHGMLNVMQYHGPVLSRKMSPRGLRKMMLQFEHERFKRWHQRWSADYARLRRKQGEEHV